MFIYELISIKKGTAYNYFILTFSSIEVLFDRCFIDFSAGESCIFGDKDKKCNNLYFPPHSLYDLPPYLIRICVLCACLQLSWQPCCIVFLAMSYPVIFKLVTILTKTKTCISFN